MKTIPLFNFIYLSLIITILFTKEALAQDYPPAPGPPAPTAPINNISNSFLINLVENTIKEKVAEANTRIQQDKPRTGINAKVSFSLKVFKPDMTTTTDQDQPNQNIIRFSFRAEYRITDISWHGVPYFSRKIGQSIDVFVSCKEWFTNNGLINMLVVSQPAILDDASFGEQVLNLFIKNLLTDFVDGKIKAQLSGAFLSTETPFPCNCLGIDPGTGARSYKDGSIQYAKKTARPQAPTVFNTATVTLKSIKRLKARSMPHNQFMYKEVEDIQLLFYVNNNLQVVQLDQLREGDVRLIDGQTTSFPRPNDRGNIILIAVIEVLSANKDSRFKVYNRSTNFGSGTQKLIVTKSYWEPPQRSRNGGMTKPLEVKVDAYEITVQITAPIPEVSVGRN